MEKYYIDDVPGGMMVISYLDQRTSFFKIASGVAAKVTYPEVITIDGLDLDIPAIERSVNEALALYGDHGWQSQDGTDPYYTGFSLAYNPDHQDGPNIHASTLGTPKNKKNQFFWNVTQYHTKIKDSYFDTYGFRVRTPASRYSALGVLLDRSQRTLIRSRVSIIHGNQHTPEHKTNWGWHRDEVVFSNLRLNIPIVTSPNYLFQIERKAPRHLPVGFGYSWDTHIPHRVFSERPSNDVRTHLVLGFSPWFDYLPHERAWVKNEFFGKLHPFDMLREDFIFKGVKLRDEIKIY